MADWFKCNALKFERSFNAREILEDELLADRFINFAICKSKAFKLFTFNFFLELTHHIHTKHTHKIIFDPCFRLNIRKTCNNWGLSVVQRILSWRLYCLTWILGYFMANIETKRVSFKFKTKRNLKIINMTDKQLIYHTSKV